MQFRKILLVLFVLLQYSYAQYGCTLYEDSYVYFQNSTLGNVTVHYYAHNRQGWFAIGFSNSEGFKVPQEYLIFALPNNHSRIYPNVDTTLFSLKIENMTSLTIDNAFWVKFDIPYTTIRHKKYINFARGYEAYPTTFDMILQKGSYGQRLSPFAQNTTEVFQIGYCSPYYFKQTGRLLGNWLPAMIATQAFYILLFIICIAFRDHDPLSKRGLGPFIIIGAYSINLIGDYFFIYVTHESSYNFSCGYNLVVYCSIQAGLLVQLISYLRYFTIINLNNQKQKIELANRFQPFWMKFSKNLEHPVVIFFVPLAGILFYLMLTVISYVIWGFSCGSTAVTVNRFINYALMVIYGMGLAIIQIIDILSNIKLICNCKFNIHDFGLRQYFVVKDHYFFRMDILVSPFFWIVAVIWILSLSWSPSLIRLFLCETYYSLSLLSQTLIPLFITIVQWIRSRFAKVPMGAGKIEDIFNDQELEKLFIEFSKQEWSMENAYFKKYCVDFRKARKDRRKSLAKEMIAKFLNFQDSVFEINVPRSKITEVINVMENEEDLPETLFLDLEKEIMANLNDVYHRFVQSREYLFELEKRESLGVSVSPVTPILSK